MPLSMLHDNFVLFLRNSSKAALPRLLLLSTLLYGSGLACSAASGKPNTKSVAAVLCLDNSPDVHELPKLDILNQGVTALVTEDYDYFPGTDIPDWLQQRSDPYGAFNRPLSTADAQVRSWIDTQSNRSCRWLKNQQDILNERLFRELIAKGDIDRLRIGGNNVFFRLQKDGQEARSLYVAPNMGQAKPLLSNPSRAYQRLGEDAEIWSMSASPHGNYLAFTIEKTFPFGESGEPARDHVLYIADVSSGEILEEEIAGARYVKVAWEPDESAFYYTRFPIPGEESFESFSQDTGRSVYRHILHTDITKDVKAVLDGEGVVGEKGAPNWWPILSGSLSARWLIVTDFWKRDGQDLYLIDKTKLPAKPIRVLPGRANGYTVSGQLHETEGGTHLYVRTTENAPRGKIITHPIEATVSEQLADSHAWETVLEEDSSRQISTWLVSDDGTMITTYVDGLSTSVRRQSSTGKVTEESLEFATTWIGYGFADDGSLILLKEGFSLPPRVERLAQGGQRSTLFEIEAPGGVDLQDFVVWEATVPSGEVNVPITVLQRRDVVLDGEVPVFVFGYGAYDTPVLPSFRRSALYFAQRFKGLYVLVHTRGTGGQGQDWYTAGRGVNKPNTFEDFKAAVNWLQSPHPIPQNATTAGIQMTGQTISRPEKIMLYGGSAGGLLMGAMVSEAPNTFGAAFANVGIYDMLADPWMPVGTGDDSLMEFGDPNDPVERAIVASYSPYDTIESNWQKSVSSGENEGSRPWVFLLSAGERDDLVHWGHSAKFAARIQTLQSGEARSAQAVTSGTPPVFFYMDKDAGHQTTTLSQFYQFYAKMFTFFAARLEAAELDHELEEVSEVTDAKEQ